MTMGTSLPVCRVSPRARDGEGLRPGNTVRIRSMTEQDLEGVAELRHLVPWRTNPEAFGILRKSLRSARWAVAEASPDVLVGMVGAVPLGKTGILCHLGVHPTYRGRGLGTGLASWAISYLRSHGTRVVRLESTPEAKGIYEALGFRSVGRRVLYHREAGARALPAVDRAYTIAPVRPGDLPELYGIDRRSFGGDRSTLLRAILRRHEGAGLVARDARGRMVGYLLKCGTHLGPWISSTPRVAKALVIHALARGERKSTGVVSPEDGPAHELLERLGFDGVPDRTRMVLGASLEPDNPRTYGLSPYLVT
jgi:ribosomal protein S18 acetylase RimI-like enzyme